jgi:hypothetical protein
MSGFCALCAIGPNFLLVDCNKTNGAAVIGG